MSDDDPSKRLVALALFLLVLSGIAAGADHQASTRVVVKQKRIQRPNLEYLPPPAPSQDSSLFDAVQANKQTSNRDDGRLSLFDNDNVLFPPPAPSGEVPRVVVSNGKVIVSSLDRQDGGSLFDLEAGYADSPSNPPFRPSSPSAPIRATTRRPLTVTTMTSIETRPSPPRLPFTPDPDHSSTDLFDLPPGVLPPAPPPDEEMPLPPSAPVTAIIQSDGKVNQVSLTWAQLQAMLSPTTDIASIISAITSSGQAVMVPGPSGPFPPAPPQPTGVVVGPPSPPTGPIGPPAPPTGPIGPPAPPFGGRPTLPSLPSTFSTLLPGIVGAGLSLIPGGNIINSFLRPGDAPNGQQYGQQQQQQFVQQQQFGQQQQSGAGPTIIIYPGVLSPSAPAQQQNPAGQQQFNYGGFSNAPANPAANPPSSYDPSLTAIPANPSAFNQPANPPPLNLAVFNPSASPSSQNYANFNQPSNQPAFNPPSQNYLNFNPPSNPAAFNPPSQNYANFNSPSNQQTFNPPFTPQANPPSQNYGNFNQPAPPANPPALNPPSSQIYVPAIPPAGANSPPVSFNNPSSNPSNSPAIFVNFNSAPAAPAAPPATQPVLFSPAVQAVFASPPQPPAPPPLPPAPPLITYGTSSGQNSPSSYGQPAFSPPARDPPSRSPQIVYGQQDLPSYVIVNQPASPPATQAVFQDPAPVQAVQLAVLSPPPVTYVVQQQPQQAQQAFLLQPAAQPVFQQQQQPLAFQQVQPVFDPVYRPAAQPVFRVPIGSGNSNNKAKAFGFGAKAKGKLGKGKDKGPSFKNPPSSYGAPPSYYPPPSTEPPQDPPQVQDQNVVGLLQPQLDIQYQYRYSGPPIITRGHKAAKKLKKLFYKGAVLLGGLGAISAAPIVPGVIGGARRKRQDEPGLVPKKEFLRDSYQRRIDDQEGVNNKSLTSSSSSSSLFDSLPFQGAPIPKALRKELARYMPPAETFTDAECLQKSFCENLMELENSVYQESILFFYSALSPEADSNPWLQQSLTAARKKKCSEFYCAKSPELTALDAADDQDVQSTDPPPL